MTVSLEIRLHRPVPLETPLRAHARVTGTEDRKIRAGGSVSTEQDPSVALVAADAVFISPESDRARALVPST